MNKKTLFLIFFSALILPFIANAAEAPSQFCQMVLAITKLSWWIGGSVVVIGWVVAGILYLTSGGGERMVIAKKALIAAVIGTILVVISGSAAILVKDALQFGSLSQCGSLQ
ncbi:MAG: hypothetical protein AAB352_03085 [Patescibacteria group bacterium]